jgi:hypothetical protein
MSAYQTARGPSKDLLASLLAGAAELLSAVESVEMQFSEIPNDGGDDDFDELAEVQLRIESARQILDPARFSQHLATLRDPDERIVAARDQEDLESHREEVAGVNRAFRNIQDGMRRLDELRVANPPGTDQLAAALKDQSMDVSAVGPLAASLLGMDDAEAVAFVAGWRHVLGR